MTQRAFRRMQISNIEDTVGTAEAATRVILGTGTFEEVQAHHQPNEDRNNLVLHMADDTFVGTEVHLTVNQDLNAQDAIYWAGMAIRGNITATQPDSTNQPNAYLWTHEHGYTTANTPDIANGINTHTLEYGDNTQAYETEYCFVTRLTISGAPNEVCTLSAEIVGRQRTDTTFTGALSAPTTLQRIAFNRCKLYVDTSWANLGNTQKTGLLRGFTWEFDTGFRPFYTADGNLYFAKVAETKKAPVLTMTFVAGSDADAERTKWEARTTTFVRLALLGATELDSGQSNPPYVQIDSAIRYRTWPEWSEDEGLTTYQVVADTVYDATGASSFEIACLNLLAAIT